MAIIIDHHRSGRRSFSTILLRLLSSYSLAIYLYKDKQGDVKSYTFAQIQVKVKQDYPGGCHVYTGGTVDDNIVPDDVTTVIIDIDTPIIADFAFAEIESLERVIFHDNITKIGMRAFAHSGLEGKVVIPKKVTKIERHTFAHCPKLKSLVLHDNITEIGARAFAHSGRRGKVIIKHVINKE